MYAVEWLDVAADELSAIARRADPDTRAAIGPAVRRIGDRLRLIPSVYGEPRSPEGVRFAFGLPLGILYRVEHHPHVVTVLRVWQVHERRK
jgi:hypothetical protein